MLMRRSVGPVGASFRREAIRREAIRRSVGPVGATIRREAIRREARLPRGVATFPRAASGRLRSREVACGAPGT